MSIVFLSRALSLCSRHSLVSICRRSSSAAAELSLPFIFRTGQYRQNQPTDQPHKTSDKNKQTPTPKISLRSSFLVRHLYPFFVVPPIFVFWSESHPLFCSVLFCSAVQQTGRITDRQAAFVYYEQTRVLLFTIFYFPRILWFRSLLLLCACSARALLSVVCSHLDLIPPFFRFLSVALFSDLFS